MKRDIAIDYLRSSVTVLVVAHHAALAYNTFSRYDPSHYTKSSAPIVDTVRFMPLDILVGWNDLFFMALMFLISGIFVAPSIGRKGIGRFLAERAKRLGIPFLIAATLLGPIAYFPSWLLSDSDSQQNFLSGFFTTDEGSAGPGWFIWVLLGFSFVVAAAYKFIPNLMKKLSWFPGSARSLVFVFLAVSLVTIIPVHLIVAEEWLRLFGPVYLPALRVLLYFAWFLLGIALGGGKPERSLSRENLRFWPVWLAVGAVGYMVHGTLTSGGYLIAMPLLGMKLLLGTAYAFCCTFTSLAAIGLARSLFRINWSVANNFSENAYGTYIFHYGFVTWLQFGLLTQAMPAAAKFFITFSVALTASWFLTDFLRKTVLGRVL